MYIPSKLMVPLLSVSISFMRSSSSVSEGLRFRERITAPSSEAVISPGDFEVEELDWICSVHDICRKYK